MTIVTTSWLLSVLSMYSQQKWPLSDRFTMMLAAITMRRMLQLTERLVASSRSTDIMTSFSLALMFNLIFSVSLKKRQERTEKSSLKYKINPSLGLWGECSNPFPQCYLIWAMLPLDMTPECRFKAYCPVHSALHNQKWPKEAELNKEL